MINNSDDKFDNDIPLQVSRAHGGILTLFKKQFEPYVTEIKIESSRIQPIQVNIPGYQTSYHINIYLPISGKDA